MLYAMNKPLIKNAPKNAIKKSKPTWRYPASCRQVAVCHLGEIGYQKAWDLQEALCQRLVTRKLQRREKNTQQSMNGSHYLLLCYHPPVITLGRKAKAAHVLADRNRLAAEGVELFAVNRGGDVTYHGPGQLVVYPILDLDFFYHDIHRLLRDLETVVINTLAQYGVIGQRLTNHTGVWVEQQGRINKIAAMGLRCSHWVSMHGLAFNVQTELTHFSKIVPCGIAADQHGIVSLHQLVQEPLDLVQVEQQVLTAMVRVFDMQLCSLYPKVCSAEDLLAQKRE